MEGGLNPHLRKLNCLMTSMCASPQSKESVRRLSGAPSSVVLTHSFIFRSSDDICTFLMALAETGRPGEEFRSSVLLLCSGGAV